MSYITYDGYIRLTEELQTLWKVKRPQIVKAITIAAAEGDRSENAEYIYRKKELRETDRKIRFLEKQLKHIEVVRDKPKNHNKVFFGAKVTLEDMDGESKVYRLVGSIEARAEKDEISYLSPVAQALLGKELEDNVHVNLPDNRQAHFIIIKIEY